MAINAVFRCATVLLGLVSMVAGAALPSQETEHSILRRSTHDSSTWDKYHEINGAFARQGLCMSYIDPTPRDGTWACGKFCNNENQRVCWTPSASLQFDHLINKNPDGARWVVGECHCDTGLDKIANTLVDFTGRGLEEGFGVLLKVTCEVTMNVLKEAALLGVSFIPGAGQYAAAARVVAKGVKLAAKTSGGRDIWKETVEGTCGAFDERAEINAGYDVLLAMNDPEE